MKKETKESLVFWFAVASTLLTFVALVALIAAQTYIRWAVNQDFTFLGEAGVPSLSILLLGQILGLLRYVRA
ncbi:hypothetical protein A3C20_05030 [Candidatus Kaiserbacteria bacterium RIFCSPHIGHO2_02_FULL_55_25]|uniref:Uncharacterized protein n=1 Tax=Candidatus Kaiserbacteria bacterium RIFCSPHIGHO2_02_FULL_55_25 TaxID=1798498 RepID=A0A1F6E5Y4_9BACT|nr:MAG: hypothetical protein A2764_01045 [Candidatus Kaiserbacteria bacterium RIFCSPHIGHO2_01_FULL_55_79]OGG69114.1 MAG: hypothetical protein A3C20_05030 [Candidatus Kaiserbacteria bacterium RIFCSPHIGHO2_02_FULL_55_25]OGG77503.1 MAG: hypothetical protein A3F56_01595 [Candidatus Kaiserbacteria bacterium RIFCSPHIGHO2_12_FULL_55_13]OGG83145.1 MAG: hypothetical protein A3A42_01130 [Candidatus Kaiserbacteria bacterium RIFCSPLOWO2_01_FULL_55_25]HJZ10907.1 hypothetical protein [Acidobacteriota bacteri